MEVKDITCDFLISKVKNHKKHKTILLDLINRMPKSKSQQNSKSDWLLSKDHPREYLNYFYNDIIDPIMDKQKKHFKADQWHIANAWFQQYHDGTFHKFHNHESTNWSNVYFVELPDNSVATKFKDIDINDIKTGDMITFPGYLLHESPKNLSGKRKTIISFNSNYSDYTEH